MRVAIIQFPGATGIRELKQALSRVGMEPVDIFWNDALYKLQKCVAFIVVGGETSQGSFHLSVIAAHSLMMKAVKKVAAEGKLVFGVGVGAQILLEAGLILEKSQQIALTENKRVYFDRIVGNGFCCAETYIRLHPKAKSPIFTLSISPTAIFRLPLMQTEGRFVMSEVLANFLQDEGLVVFQYCDVTGNVVDDFPVNPNASAKNIAAISNYAGNVLAIVPRPERSSQGDGIFSAMRDFIEEKESLRAGVMPAFSEKNTEKHINNSAGHELFFESLWLDQETSLIQHWFQKQDLHVKIKRYFYWNIVCSDGVLQKIERTQVLMGPQKSLPVEKNKIFKANQQALLVQPKDDVKGAQKKQLLTNHFEVDGIKSMQSGIVWLFATQDVAVIEKALSLNFIFNSAISATKKVI